MGARLRIMHLGRARHLAPGISKLESRSLNPLENEMKCLGIESRQINIGGIDEQFAGRLRRLYRPDFRMAFISFSFRLSAS
jgi:hypothetical protein